MSRLIVLAGLLWGWPSLAWAETAYVTDILRLGLHRAQDTNDPAFRTLVSGTELEIMERLPNYARVRTGEGQQGWVKSAYLVLEKPAQLRVSEVGAEIARMREELNRAQAAQLVAEHEAQRLSEAVSADADSSAAIGTALARLKQENASFEARLETYRQSVPLRWAGAAFAVALIAGFFTGVFWLDYVSRRRHGGFRIY